MRVALAQAVQVCGQPKASFDDARIPKQPSQQDAEALLQRRQLGKPPLLPCRLWLPLQRWAHHTPLILPLLLLLRCGSCQGRRA